jgi:hypothetical protein
MDVIRVARNAQPLVRVRPGFASSLGKKTDEGTMMSPPQPNSKSNPSIASNAPETQTLTPETTKDATDIVKSKICF